MSMLNNKAKITLIKKEYDVDSMKEKHLIIFYSIFFEGILKVNNLYCRS